MLAWRGKGSALLDAVDRVTAAVLTFTSNHATKHLPNSTIDPLAVDVPVAVGDANAAGVANAFARSDHVHAQGALRAPVILWHRTGLSSTSTTNTAEPMSWGSAGMLLATYQMIPLSAIRGAGTVTRLRLIAALTAVGGAAGVTVNVKPGVRLNGSSAVRFAPAQSVTGTTPAKMFFDLDLMPYVADLADGDLFAALGVWVSNGTGSIGASSVSEPNPTFGVLVEVKNF